MKLCWRHINQMRLLPEEQWDITVAGLPVYWTFPHVILMPFQAACFQLAEAMKRRASSHAGSVA